MGTLREWWDDLQFLAERRPVLDRFAPSARRYLWCIIWILGCVLTPVRQYTTAWISTITPDAVARHKDHLVAGIRAFFDKGAFAILLLVAAGIVAYLICWALTIFIKSVNSALIPKSKSLLLVDQLVTRLGISELFVALTGEPLSVQTYAGAMNAAVANSKKVKILSIAAFEYLGKGSEALLYNTVKAHPKTEVKCVLLNHVKCPEVIAKRVHDLEKREPSLTSEQICGNIVETIKTVGSLNGDREVAIELRLCNWHPIFRLVICDNCLFLSAYGTAAHGHESPVLQIARHSKTSPGSDTLYRSFDDYFDSIWKASSTV